VKECINRWTDTSDDNFLYSSLVEDTYLHEFLDGVKDFYARDFRAAGASKDLAKQKLDDIMEYNKNNNKKLHQNRKTLHDPDASEDDKKVAKTAIDVIQNRKNKMGEELRGHEWDATKHFAKGSGKTALTGAGLYAGYKGIGKLVQMAIERPKSWIGKKIASLRKIYSNWMNAAQRSADKSNSSMIKNAARKILTVIDKLLEILQKRAG
jgi:hypothetical protein